ncbi:transcription factor SAC51-like [Iris pallida]|uniref:Transcription factor SAC51-like n=1 Tax=Iris pallida TaxID=29817 RepID=A0AAX6DJL7_IRIPA|nr:transcription factor SAC51-like [Iris pallida]
MGKDQNPWRSRKFEPASEFIPLGRKRSNPTMYPFYAGGLPVNSSLFPPSNPVGFTSCKRSYMVFDRSGDQTSLVFGSLGTQCPHASLPGRGENYVGPEREDSHKEDSEDIDALLYSDFGNESEASTGYSPVQNVTAESSAVVIPHSLPPPKRRRFEPNSYESELNPLAEDTASSTFHADDEEDRTKAKRERIQETVRVIRRLIPGRRNAEEEDAMSLLDEAIRYLKSLRLKAKELGGSSL